MKMTTYPIIKFPHNFAIKLSKQQMLVTSIITEERFEDPVRTGFTNLFSAALPPRPRAYHRYILVAIGLICCGLVAGAVLHKLLGWMLGVGAVTAIGLTVVYAVLLVKYQQAMSARFSFREATPTRKPVLPGAKHLVKLRVSKSVAIDWSSEVDRVVRSHQKSTAQVGVSEEYFFKYLKAAFPRRCSFGHVYLPDGYQHPYSADMEVILPNGLAIQVEIDEPYAGRTREPHHCTDNNKDVNRDRYFLSIGWIIIRFSEKQIVTNPRGCCAVISRVAYQLAGVPCNRQIAVAAESLELDRAWTSKVAARWAKEGYRETYLSAAGLWNVRSSEGKSNSKRRKN
jgi:hypothetical protein